jgi:FkbM family methyltransferase
MTGFQLVPGCNVEVRDGTLDDVVFNESWRDDTYRMTTLPKPNGGAALDLGANVGAWSILAAKAGAPVYAVEVWAGNNDRHCINKEAAGVADKIVIFEAAAVGHSVDKVALDNIGDTSQVGVQIHDVIDDRYETRPMVKAIHINDLLVLRERWWCMKVDIEGGEYDVFAGANLGLLNRVDYIVGEFHGASTGEHVKWIGDKQFGDLMTKLCDWGNITTMGRSRTGGMFFGHRFGVQAPLLGAERIPIARWLRQ